MVTREEIIAIRIPQPRFSVINAITKRFSPRIFSSEQIPQEHIYSICEAARLTPSAKNLQPWLFYWTRKGAKAYEALFSCVGERNLWAKTAPLVILASYNPLDQKGETNIWAQYDLGQAVISLILQAQELGYYARQIGIFDTEKAKQVLAVPNPYKPFILISLGKIGTDEDYKSANKDFAEKDLIPAVRKDSIAQELS
jgi:nitroreductase